MAEIMPSERVDEISDLADQKYTFGFGVVQNLADSHEALRAQVATLVAALREAEAYFDQRADAETSPGGIGPVGNIEMKLLVLVREALEAAGAGGEHAD